MKKLIKVSFFLKTLAYLHLFLILVATILFPSSYLSLTFFISLLFLLLPLVLFYFVLLNQLVAIKLYWVYLTLYTWVVSSGWLWVLLWTWFYSITKTSSVISWEDSVVNQSPLVFIIISILFLALVILNLYFLHKNIKKWVENVNPSLVTSGKQGRSFLIIFSLTTIFLLIFRFWYYSIEKDMKKIDDSFFITKLQNVDVKDSDNLYPDLKNFKFEEDSKLSKLKPIIVDCYYNDICYGGLDFYKNIIENNSGSLDKKSKITDSSEKWTIKSYLKDNMSILYIFKDENFDRSIDNLLVNLSQKPYFKYGIEDEDPIFTWFIAFNRELQYKILYYLNNNEEEKWIALLNAQMRTLQTMLDWDVRSISIMVNTKVLRMWLENIDLILKNFNLTNYSKNLLLGTLQKNIDFIGSMDNSLKNENKYFLKFLKEPEWLPSGTTFFDKNYTERLLKDISFRLIQNKWVIADDLISDYASLNPMKSNQIWQILLRGSIADFWSAYRKLADLKEFRDALILKLQVN